MSAWPRGEEPIRLPLPHVVRRWLWRALARSARGWNYLRNALASRDLTKRLVIVIPYRDRKAHLDAMLPRLVAFLRAGKHAGLRFSISIIEQAGSDAFNRGLLKNIGFAIAKDQGDYFCFHDVDYFPIDADYSYPRSPTRLIWHGLALPDDYFNFFGGVILFPKTDFERVNGYSNDYWGWGFEDTDLRRRCRLAGVPLGRRDGTYGSLPHVHLGWTADKRPTAEQLRTKAVFRQKRQREDALFMREGLRTISYTIRQTRTYRPAGLEIDSVHWYEVEVRPHD
jgi:hypothetical protein